VYVCGITPYDTTHLGHAATFVWGDVAARVLRHAGVDVEVCRNVTDVDDVLDAAAAAPGHGSTASPRCSSSGSTATWPRSVCAGPRTSRARTTSCAQVEALAAALLEAGAAYERGGTVWFRVRTWPPGPGWPSRRRGRWRASSVRPRRRRHPRP
jgi:cysteinyl-tRNA synthetase